MHSKRLTYRESLIASRDEVDIEDELISIQNSSDEDREFLTKFATEQRKALHDIARLKVSGRYEEERERLSKLIMEDMAAAEAAFHAANPHVPDFREMEINPKLEKALRNLFKGLRSPNPDQRTRFQAFYEATGLANMSPIQSLPLIAALEPAEEKNGRPSVSPPWRNVAWALDEMRILVANGASVARAAQDVATNEGHVTQESRAKYFARCYAQREGLRK